MMSINVKRFYFFSGLQYEKSVRELEIIIDPAPLLFLKTKTEILIILKTLTWLDEIY